MREVAARRAQTTTPCFCSLSFYNKLRPHQAKDNLPLSGAAPPPTAAFVAEDIVCEERLGGLLKHVHRRVA
jgi:hypothetical protein